VLVVLYDDTGQAAWSPYGGRINMPTMQRLADNGPTYTQWHTTALCSPTRRDGPTFGRDGPTFGREGVAPFAR
jgi:arylsulfatase A-like enzyme